MGPGNIVVNSPQIKKDRGAITASYNSRRFRNNKDKNNKLSRVTLKDWDEKTNKMSSKTGMSVASDSERNRPKQK